MKSALALVCFTAVAEASLLTDAKDFMQSPKAFLVDHNVPVTRHDVKTQITVRNHEFKTNPNHQMLLEQSHHNIRAQRERLGLAKVGAGSESILASYDNLNGFSANLLGVAKGLQYNPNDTSMNKCFTAVEGLLIATDNSLHIISKLIYPWYLAEVQLVVQDLVALNAGFYSDCDANKFFNTMTQLISAEGVSEISARASGAYFFEYKNFKAIRAEAGASSYVKGKEFGKLFSVLSAYKI